LQLSEEQKRVLGAFLTSRNTGNASMRQVVIHLVNQIGDLTAMLSASYEEVNLNYSKFSDGVRIIEGLRRGLADVHHHVKGETTREEAAASLGATLEAFRDVRHFHPDLVALEEELNARPTKRAHIETQTQTQTQTHSADASTETHSATETVDASTETPATERVDATTETHSATETVDASTETHSATERVDASTERVDASTETGPQTLTLSSNIKYNLVVRFADGTTYTY
jgi:hypothetical protein